ncbi:hypothetical protein ABIB25_005189 [Nakamurella sp. UYEF19]|uniref:hypothetical protein n=1 Tax=Nakamurella sp. UYEF19 TaxID=1756392 RepID=UPI003399DBA6
MLDRDGRSCTAAEVILLALSAHSLTPIVMRRSDATSMTALRRQLRRAAKDINVTAHISIINDDSMKVSARDRFSDTLVRRAMDIPDGI